MNCFHAFCFCFRFYFELSNNLNEAKVFILFFADIEFVSACGCCCCFAFTCFPLVVDFWMHQGWLNQLSQTCWTEKSSCLQRKCEAITKTFFTEWAVHWKWKEKHNNQKKEQKNAAAIFFFSKLSFGASTSFALVYCAENKLYHVFLFQLVICSEPLSFGRKRKIEFSCIDDGTERDLCIIDLMQKNMIDEHRSAGFFQQQIDNNQKNPKHILTWN